MIKRSNRGEIIFFICLFCIVTAIFLIGVLLSVYLDVPFGNFTRDPSSIHPSSKFYYGFISNFGVLFWSFTASICLYSYALMKKVSTSTFINMKSFFLWSGAISLLLLLDDLFLLHEKVFPWMLPLNEKIIFSLYGILIVVHLLKHKKLILANTKYFYLVLSLVFFGLSLIFDFAPRFSEKWHHMFEDGPKFIGIVFWFGFHAITARSFLIAHFENSKE